MGLTFIYYSKMHGHSNIKWTRYWVWGSIDLCLLLQRPICCGAHSAPIHWVPGAFSVRQGDHFNLLRRLKIQMCIHALSYTCSCDFAKLRSYTGVCVCVFISVFNGLQPSGICMTRYSIRNCIFVTYCNGSQRTSIVYSFRALSITKFTTLNQQNAQMCSLDVYHTVQHWMFLHALVRIGPSLGIKPN